MVRVSMLTCEFVDLLVYCLSGVMPNAKVCDLGCTFKGECRDAIHIQYDSRMKKNPTRLSLMSEEMDNLPLVALRVGYPVDFSLLS